jgi:hypothetical protein
MQYPPHVKWYVTEPNVFSKILWEG